MRIRKKRIGGVRFMGRFILMCMVAIWTLIVIVFFSSCSLLRKKSPDNYMESGKRYYEKKEYHKSYRDYTRAIELSPILYLAYWERSKVDIAIDSLEKAIDDMSMYIESGPDTASLIKAYGKRAEVMLKLGYKSDACADYMSACTFGGDTICEKYRINCK